MARLALCLQIQIQFEQQKSLHSIFPGNELHPKSGDSLELISTFWIYFSKLEIFSENTTSN